MSPYPLFISYKIVTSSIYFTADLKSMYQLVLYVHFARRKVLWISSGIHQIGSLKWDLVLCLLLAWIVVYLCIFKGIRTSGKVMLSISLTKGYMKTRYSCIHTSSRVGNIFVWKAVNPVSFPGQGIPRDSDDHYNGSPASLDPQRHLKEPWRC